MRSFLKRSLSILGTPEAPGALPTPSMNRESKIWRRVAFCLGTVGLLLALLYFGTSILPAWFGYALGPLGLAAYLSLVQSQEALRHRSASESSKTK